MSMEIKSAEFVTSMADYGDFTGKGLPQIAVAGKSNVGKSTLINKLCRRNKLARTSSTPGKTRLLNIFLLNEEFHLVDLPGYGFAKVDKKEKQRWGQMMQDYFTKADELLHVLCLVDIRHEPTEDDRQMNRFLLGEAEEPRAEEQDELSEAVRMAKSIGVTVQINGEAPREAQIRGIIAQTITECAANTVKHAEGDALSVELMDNGKSVLLSITNNGRPPKGEIAESGGLLALRRKVEDAGGRMHVESDPVFVLTLQISWKTNSEQSQNF